MTRLNIAEATDSDWNAGRAALSNWKAGKPATSRLENGLHIAFGWSERHGIELGVLEERRLEFAFSRVVAREASLHSEPAILGSVDYARMLLVDAALQREAGAALDLDVLDRAERFNWSTPDMYDVPFVRADTAPTELAEMPEAVLAALREGHFEDIPGDRRQDLELMLLRGGSPREDDFERELHHVEALLLRGEWAVARAEFGPNSDPLDLARKTDANDLERFGAHERSGGLTRAELGGVVDRLAQAREAETSREGSKALYDPRPGHNPFAPDLTKDGLQYATLTAVKNGRVANQLERSVRIAMEFQQERGVTLDRPAIRRMESAVMRLVSRRENRALSEEEAVKALIVDSVIQKTAAEKLAVKPRRSGAEMDAPTPSEKILGEMLGRGSYPVFTKLPVEREDTKAVAQGRFHDLTDDRGIGSSIRSAIYRSGRVLNGPVANDLARLAKAHTVSDHRSPGWIEHSDETMRARGNARSTAKGPKADAPLFQKPGMSR